MAKKDANQPDQPLRETEQAAYHAYREWPVLLVLRLKELAALKAAPPATNTKPDEDKRS
jgi:hypothetical protein